VDDQHVEEEKMTSLGCYHVASGDENGVGSAWKVYVAHGDAIVGGYLVQYETAPDPVAGV